MHLTYNEFTYIGKCLGGFFFGLYSGIFVLHLRCHASKKQSNKKNIIFYALCVLYVLSAIVIALDIAYCVAYVLNNDISLTYRIYVAEAILFGCCDFIAQSILIHRCWIVWNCNARVVIVPSFLAFTYLVMWTASVGASFISQDKSIETPHWSNILSLTGLTASMTVNALVTGMIIFRIFRVFRRVKSVTPSNEKSLGLAEGRELRSIIFVIIESGMALFAIQLVRLVISASDLKTEGENDAFTLVIAIHETFNGITPTIILVRVAMGLSFHDEPSLVEVVSSLQFTADSLNPRTGETSQDGSLCIEPDDPDAILDVADIIEERREDESGRGDNIQKVD